MGQLEPKRPYPVLTKEEQSQFSTSNFITESIHQVAITTPGLSSDSHFNHLLSSYPMVINLFGFLINPREMAKSTLLTTNQFDNNLESYAPSKSASQFISALLNRSIEVLRIDFEIPGRLKHTEKSSPLLDHTSLDAIIEYEDENGFGIIGIETKLTEKLSNGSDLRDSKKRYSDFYDRHKSPFASTMTPEIEHYARKNILVQWIRNHLLMYAYSELANYNSCHYWVVYPDSHLEAKDAAVKYPSLLSDSSFAFKAITLEEIVSIWKPIMKTEKDHFWCEEFNRRYLDMSLSENLWTALKDVNAV